MINDWAQLAACRDHESLHPDSWFELTRGHPTDFGCRALAVCQRSCPVMLDCREYYFGHPPESEVIAGGGWWDNKRNWHMVPVEYVPGDRNPFRPRPQKEKVHKPIEEEEEHDSPLLDLGQNCEMAA